MKKSGAGGGQFENRYKYDRYVLLHELYQPIADRFIRKLDPYISKFKPIIGFSKEEAVKAAYIVYVSPSQILSPQEKKWFRSRGNLLKIIRPKDINELIAENI